jgi:hypothetical protein
MSWINIQHLYMPSLHVLRERDDHRLPSNQPEEPVSDIKLYLPSSVTLHSNIVCDNRLCQLEWELRQAQAQDALHELHDSLRLRSYVYMDKDRFQRGQRRNTRSRGIIDRLEVKVNAAAAKYRAARQAISTLASPLNQVGWAINFPILNASDIKGLTDTSTPEHYRRRTDTSRGSRQDRNFRESEGHRDISWIWKQLGSLENTDELLQDGESSMIFSIPL